MSQLAKLEFSIKNIKLFKYLLITSGAIAGEDAINISFEKDRLTSIQNNSSESCYKKWVINYDNFIYDLNGFDEIKLNNNSVKISIFRGLDFAKKILSFFESFDENTEIVKMSINYDAVYSVAKNIEITKNDKSTNRVKLGFKVPTANALMYFVEYEKTTVDVLFGGYDVPMVSNIGRLSMEPNQIKDAKELFRVVTDDELQQNYIAFKLNKTTNQVLLTDETIDYELFVSTDNKKLGALLNRKIEVSKDLFGLLDPKLSYDVEFKKFVDEIGRENIIVSFIVSGRTDFELITAFSVLIDVDDDFDFKELTDNDDPF